MKPVLLVVQFALLASALGDEKCTSQAGTCKCNTNSGAIDLSPLDNPSNPLVWQQSGALWSYKYNPCTAFACGSAGQVALCEQYTGGATYFNIGDQNTALFQYDSGTQQNYIQYTTTGYTSKVYLICDRNENGRITSGPNAPAGTYTFKLSSKYSCPGSGPSGGGGLSPGSVLLIIFFSLLVAYLICGMLFMHFVKHQTGLQLVPNVELWVQVPGLIRDGCVLTYSTVVTMVSGGNRSGYNSA